MLYKIVLSLLGVSLIACGSADARSLRGTWVSKDPHMVAHVSKNSIRIDHKFSDGDSALYWKGTFRSNLANGQWFRSLPDTEALEFSLFGSTAKSKKFTHRNNRLIFQFSIMGVNRKVSLVRKFA